MKMRHIKPSMEVELLDRQTSEQVAAIVESQKGTRIPFANLGDWDDAKQMTKDWAKSL